MCLPARVPVPTGTVHGGAAVPAGVAVPAATAVAGGAGGPAAAAATARTTGQYARVQTYNPEYDKWPSFQHGDNLYSELSTNIHSYNKSYNVEEINFTQSHRIILEWLSPDLDAIKRN